MIARHEISDLPDAQGRWRSELDDLVGTHQTPSGASNVSVWAPRDGAERSCSPRKQAAIGPGIAGMDCPSATTLRANNSRAAKCGSATASWRLTTIEQQ